MPPKTDNLPAITVEAPDETLLGPAMQALTPMMRRFVMAKAQGMNDTNAARAAGYSNPPDKPNLCEVKGHELSKNPKILAAMMEMARAAMHGRGATVAMEALIEIAGNPAADKKDRITASNSILDRAGIAAVTKHEVAVTHQDITSDEAIKKLTDLSKKFGLDPVKVIDSVTIDAEFEEVKKAEPEEPGDETTIEGIL